jgi:hypothetical protein
LHIRLPGALSKRNPGVAFHWGHCRRDEAGGFEPKTLIANPFIDRGAEQMRVLKNARGGISKHAIGGDGAAYSGNGEIVISWQ